MVFAGNWLLGASAQDLSRKLPLGDFNGDYLINYDDIGELLNYWLYDCYEPDWCGYRDFNKSGSINFKDYSYFLQSVLYKYPFN